jgi:hypothetical protein
VPDGFARRQLPLDTRELMDPQRRLDVHHVVFESGHHDVVVGATRWRIAGPRITTHAVERRHANPLGVAADIATNTLTRRQILRRQKLKR